MGGPPKFAPGGDPSHRRRDGSRVGTDTRGYKGGDLDTRPGYVPPAVVNPGNVIHCAVGGGRMGSPLAHLNEAPFPESLVEFFIRSFTRPGDLVADCFCGSGTTGAV